MSTKLIKSNLTEKRDILRITTRDDVIPMKTLQSGTEISMVAYVVQEIVKDQEPDSEPFLTILVLDAAGRLYATRSETFIRKIDEIMDLLAEDGAPLIMSPDNPLIIKVTLQQSRSGREFVSCCLA